MAEASACDNWVAVVMADEWFAGKDKEVQADWVEARNTKAARYWLMWTPDIEHQNPEVLASIRLGLRIASGDEG